MAQKKFIAKQSLLSQNAVALAASAIGVTEKPLGSNDGPEVRLFLKSVGLPPGYAWCMAFVYHIVNAAANHMQVENPLVATGGVLHQFNTCVGKRIHKIDARKTPITADMLLPGDIFIMQFKGGLGHTGFITKVSTESVNTIEGNTDKDGGREGVGVFEKRRKIAALRGIIRILD